MERRLSGLLMVAMVIIVFYGVLKLKRCRRPTIRGF